MLDFEQGQFNLHSGKQSSWKIECDSLTQDELNLFVGMIGSAFVFTEVEGVPTGGLELARLLQPYCAVPKVVGYRRLLIVDDVLTTGGSMEDQRAGRDTADIDGVVLFSRGECPYWVTPIFQLDEKFQKY